jgi:tetratricopeptide (TPR) repeat protein
MPPVLVKLIIFAKGQECQVWKGNKKPMSKKLHFAVFVLLISLCSSCSWKALTLKQAQTLESLRNYRQAEIIYRKYVAVDTKNSDAYAGLGHCEYHANNFEGAISSLLPHDLRRPTRKAKSRAK